MKHICRFLILLGFLFSIAQVNAAISEGDEREASEKAKELAHRMLQEMLVKTLVLLDEDEQKLLREEHNAWKGFSQAAAKRQALPLKGSNMYNMVLNDANRAAMVERHAVLLNLYLDNYAIALDRAKKKE
jgi:hypothetical protein